jgi:hypothetical protein
MFTFHVTRNAISQTNVLYFDIITHYHYYYCYCSYYWPISKRWRIRCRSAQWCTEGFQTPLPPKFRNFDKAEPNSPFRGKYIRNNLTRIRISPICRLSGTPDYGATAPRSLFYLPSVLNWICRTHPHATSEENSWVRHRVCGRLVSGIAVSNPAEGMNICLFCLLCTV